MTFWQRMEKSQAPVEVTEEQYWEALEVLPPIYLKGVSWFAVSEAWSHNGNGVPIYHCFAQIAGKHFGTVGTCVEARRKFEEFANSDH